MCLIGWKVFSRQNIALEVDSNSFCSDQQISLLAYGGDNFFDPLLESRLKSEKQPRIALAAFISSN